MSPETRFLVQWLKTLKVGDIADYATMSEKAGISIVDRRHILISALQIVARDYQMVFKNVPSIGYKRIAEEDAPESIAVRCRNRIKGQTQRWRTGVNYSGQATTKEGLQSLSQCAFVEMAVDSDIQKAIAMNSRHKQAIDLSAMQANRKKALLALIGEDE